VVVAGLLALPLLPACSLAYVGNIVPAASTVHAAEQEGASEWAPYEYWLAHEYLDAAAEEGNEGNYWDAVRYAERAHDLANQAVRLTTVRRREAQRE